MVLLARAIASRAWSRVTIRYLVYKGILYLRVQHTRTLSAKLNTIVIFTRNCYRGMVYKYCIMALQYYIQAIKYNGVCVLDYYYFKIVKKQ